MKTNEETSSAAEAVGAVGGANDAGGAGGVGGAAGGADVAGSAGAVGAAGGVRGSDVVSAAGGARAAIAADFAGAASATCASNATLTQEYFDIIGQLDGDIEGRRKAHEYMANSTAIVHHQVVDCSFVPRLFNAQTRETMEYLSETAHRILVKVMERYAQDSEYRRAFSFDPRLEELILLPRGYTSVLPFARVDTFLDENTFTAKFCEFNGDGSSGMNENREITVSIAGSKAFRTFVSRHRIETCELFHSWVECFIDIYRTYEHAVEQPRFAIVDYLENGVVDEFEIFRRFFRVKGYPCEIIDVRDLRFDGRKLCGQDGQRIHAIWRRCVTNDVIDHWDESQDLIEAVRQEKVALIGSFAGHIVHDKQIFRVLHDERTRAFLTDEERTFIQQTIPYTAFLTQEEIDAQNARLTKDEWIIKPSDHYGADQVYAGCALSQADWERKLDALSRGDAGTFILQRYVTPYKTDTLPPDTKIGQLDDGDVQREAVAWNNINGLYLYDGHFAGVFSRLGPLPTISKDMQGMTAATVWVLD